MNIQFKDPAPGYIEEGLKDMTARHWLINPPVAGSRVYAQRGRKNSTRFAILEITRVWQWNPLTITSGKTDEELNRIGEREGYQDWKSFYCAYRELNAHNWNDRHRKHWFIEFKVVCLLP